MQQIFRRTSMPKCDFNNVAFLKICCKFTGEHRSAISIKLRCNFIEITLRQGCSPVNLQHIFRTPFFREHIWVAASDASIMYRSPSQNNDELHEFKIY